MIAGKKEAALNGFSLIEVVMAIGIISFALVALLGVTVVGTNAGREGRNDTDFGYVFEQISAQLRSKPFSKQQTADEANPSLFPLPRLDQNTTDAVEFYLDDQNAVAPAGTANKRVRVTVMDPPVLDEKNAPSLDGRYPHRDNLACVLVEISPHPSSPGGSGSAVYMAEICPLEQ
jgi:uncharacterized protein (TIGR02598 family)